MYSVSHTFDKPENSTIKVEILSHNDRLFNKVFNILGGGISQTSRFPHSKLANGALRQTTTRNTLTCCKISRRGIRNECKNAKGKKNAHYFSNI